MKKVIFMALATVFLLSSGFVSITPTVELDSDFPEISVSREIVVLTSNFDDDELVRCKIRTCTYVGGELQGCTAWRYTWCDKESNGSLSEHFSQSPVLIGN